MIQLIASTRLLLVLELYYRPRLFFDRGKSNYVCQPLL